jgi:hypothetical protein
MVLVTALPQSGMKRRALLSSIAVGAIGSAGCLAQTRGGNPTNTPTPTDMPEQVESVEFSIREEGAESPAAPTVEFVPSKNQVRVTGTMWAGNPCHEAHLESLTYDDQNGKLDVLVTVKKVRSGCPDSLGTDTYEVLITMQSQLPETVTATQKDIDGESQTTTASST